MSTVLPPNVPPQGPQKKSNLLFWILGGIAFVFIIGVIVIVLGVYFVMSKAKQAGLDPELMKSNPGLALTKMAAAMNPDIEVVAVNDKQGMVTVKDKKTGKVTTMKWDPENKKLVVADAEGHEATITASGDATGGNVEVKSSEGTFKWGANAGNAPAWVPAYPGAASEGGMTSETPEGSQHTFGFKTKDAPSKVIAYYQDALKSAGFTITQTMNTQGSAESGGMVMAEDAAKKRSVMLTVSTEGSETKAAIVATEKK
jgi:hypothetical protein